MKIEQPHHPSSHHGSNEERVYQTYFGLLHGIARRKFSVPDEDAHGVVHDVILSFLRVREPIRSERAWLVGAICNASRKYWRERIRQDEVKAAIEEQDPAETGMSLNHLAMQMTLKSILAQLSEKDRELLSLHYLEGYTSVEIATKMKTTSGYVRKLLHGSLARATREYRKLHEGA